MEKNICYKVAREIGGKYHSYFTSPISVKYVLGKKTKPIIGPLFAYYANSKDSIDFMVLEFKESLEIGTTNLVILECEYEAYPSSVDRIISPMFSSGIPKENYIAFWKTGELPESQNRIQAVRKYLYIDPVKHDGFARFFCFCSWIKPIRVVSLDEIASRVKEIKEAVNESV